ncbi:hypothetical protein TTHN1_00669 [Thermus thermophilus]|uniref:Uncharacterized protein n=1 Tax=Thermus thermophilus TaxID=274 RepID=A0A3P4ARC2_THETH|nr:hypothetical protein [Thermus thermophilus]VCU52914.1 hypothetical protein TTHN1_00669 [Thermus thermophilus]
MRLFHLPRPITPEGVPSLVEMAESPHVPWRWGIVRGVEAPPSRLLWDEEPLLVGQVVARLPAREWAIWGLPEWRRTVGPQGFQDAPLEAVLSWVMRVSGGKGQIQSRGAPKRHYALPRLPAWEAVLHALRAWGKEDVLHELDGEALYIGPLEASPHARVRHRVAEEVAVLRRLAEGRYYLLLPPMPRLRIYHLLEVDHPGFRGVLRVMEHRLRLSGEEAFHEVYGRSA